MQYTMWSNHLRSITMHYSSFSLCDSTNIKAAEHTSEQLKVEEERLRHLREEIGREKEALEKKRAEVERAMGTAVTIAIIYLPPTFACI